MIGRVDDCAKWQRSNFKPNDAHLEKCATACLAWSKNVNKERDAPWQHVFGCMDSVYCPLLNMALFLEVFLGAEFGAGQRAHVFCIANDEDIEVAGNKIKEKVYRALNRVLVECGMGQFDPDDQDGPLGLHSIRKYASTWA